MNWNLAAARELPAGRRWTIIGGLILVGMALLAIDFGTPAIQLRPLVFVLLVVATAFGGLRFGMTYAVIAAPAFTLAEWLNVGRTVDYWFVGNALITTASYAITPVIVIYIQQRIRFAAHLQAKLQRAEIERRQLLENEATRAALARIEANYRAVGESIPFGVWQTDDEGKLLYISESFRNICGMSSEQLLRGGWLERVPKQDADRFLDKWSHRDEGGDIWEDEYRLKGVDGKLYAILSRGVRLKDDRGQTVGWAGVSLDITERKRATDAISLLEEAGQQLMLSLDPTAILERVAAVCVPRIADWVAFDIVQEDGRLKNVIVRHADSARLETARELRAYPDDPALSRGAHSVVRTGKSELYPEIGDEMLQAAAQDERHLRLLRLVGLRSAMIVPLIVRERVIGTLTFASAESERRYDVEDLGVAQVLGVRTALAYQNAQHYAREVRVADTLQQASLPQDLPQLPGLRINATYMPGASESEIGGDWYDAFLLPDGKIGITIGDVAGKGLRAAVAMGMVRQALRGAALDGLSPSSALKRVNRHLCHERTGMVTAIAATLDPATNRLRFSSAGHPPFLVASADAPVRRMQISGVPLGLFADAGFVEEDVSLALGDLVVLYTDGLIEYDRNIATGECRLDEAASAEANNDSPNPALSIQHRVIPGRPKDDVAILTLSLAPALVDRIDVEVPASPPSARILRQALRRLMIGVGLNENSAFSLLVAAGEAISNAIEHAYGVRKGNIRVRAARLDDRLVVEISDSGAWRLPRNEGRGRGISLMRSIVDEADVVAKRSGTTVRLAVSINGSKNS